MSATRTVTEPEKTHVGRFRCVGNENAYGDFRDDLIRDGYAVIKGAVPAERAAGYVDEMYNWLEGFNLGFKRNDRSTIHKSKLPVISEKGLCMHYALPHEDFVWRIRSEPGVVKAFETIYNDEDLIVSFDAMNYAFPNRTDLPPNKPWPHQDQNPESLGFRCLQGLVNLSPNGPKDGGLIVLRGAHLLSEDFHNHFKATPEDRAEWKHEWYGFNLPDLKWFEERGCEWTKVCAEPGDLIVWDSRTPHYNLSPEGERERFVSYVCYMPVKDVSQEQLKTKRDAFERREGTTHWPNACVVRKNEVRIVSEADRSESSAGIEDPMNRIKPAKEPILDDRAFRLTGIPYIKD